MSDPDTGADRQHQVEPLPVLRRRSCWGRLLLYLIIFVSGSAVGIGGTLLVVRQRTLFAVHHPEEMPALITARMRKTLSLSDEQQQQVEGILRERQNALQNIRREVQPQIEHELDRLDEQISAVLNPEQQVKWQKRFDYLRRTWVPQPPPER